MKTKFDFKVNRVEDIPKKVYLIGKVEKQNIAEFWTSEKFELADQFYTVEEDECSGSYFLNSTNEVFDRNKAFSEEDINNFILSLNSVKIDEEVLEGLDTENLDELDKVLITLGFDKNVYSNFHRAVIARDTVRKQDPLEDEYVYFIIEGEIPKNYIYIDRKATISEERVMHFGTIITDSVVIKGVLSPTKEDLAMFWK